MLVIKVELHNANTREIKTIGNMIIYNDGMSERNDRGNYKVFVGRKGVSDFVRIVRSPMRTGEVNDYPRLSYNVWRLIIRALMAAFPEEK